ncbi:MAG: Npun_F0494 family protein [Cyanobacteriota bacterium]|jgi:hypothetical protein
MVSSPPNASTYAAAVVARAELTLCCSPFQLPLLRALGEDSLSLSAVSGEPGYALGYTCRPLGESRIEREFNWLIQVGLLRREVDGQGITDRFRLTPLGREILHNWQRLGAFPPVSCRERLQNRLRRVGAGSF